MAILRDLGAEEREPGTLVALPNERSTRRGVCDRFDTMRTLFVRRRLLLFRLRAGGHKPRDHDGRIARRPALMASDTNCWQTELETSPVDARAR